MSRNHAKMLNAESFIQANLRGSYKKLHIPEVFSRQSPKETALAKKKAENIRK